MGGNYRIWRGWSIRDWALVALAVLSAAHLLIKLSAPWVLLDADCFWYAGWLWDHGFSPYGPAFDRFKGPIFSGRETPVFFVYPPHIWPFLAPLGLVGDAAGRAIWAAINISLLAGGFALWWRVALALQVHATRLLFWLVILTCLFTGTGLALIDGQSSFIVWFGFALLAFGIVRDARWMMALALAILLIKPQFGLVALITMILLRRDWLMVVMAGAIVAVASIPALVMGGTGIAQDFTHGLSGYRGLTYNNLEWMTGLGNPIALWLHRDPSTATLELCAIVLAAAGGWLGRREPGDPRLPVSAMMGAIALFVPLHTYDLIFVPVIALILLPPATFSAWLTVAIGFALFLRPENLDHLPRLVHSATIATLGVSLLVIIPLIAHFRRFPRRSALIGPNAIGSGAGDI